MGRFSVDYEFEFDSWSDKNMHPLLHNTVLFCPWDGSECIHFVQLDLHIPVYCKLKTKIKTVESCYWEIQFLKNFFYLPVQTQSRCLSKSASWHAPMSLSLICEGVLGLMHCPSSASINDISSDGHSNSSSPFGQSTLQNVRSLNHYKNEPSKFDLRTTLL